MTQTPPSSKQLLLAAEGIDFPQCDALWHIHYPPWRCLLPVQHPARGPTRRLSVMGHFFAEGTLADWAEIAPWQLSEIDGGRFF